MATVRYSRDQPTCLGASRRVSLLEMKGAGRMTELRTDAGRRIFFDDMGAGLPLLLINGHLVARTAWDFQFPVFARHFRVVRIENRDAGENDPEAGPYSIADMA